MQRAETERRRSRRYPLVAPVLVSWKAEDGERRMVQGLTRDICPEGMYVAGEDGPPRSAVVRCEVLLPQLEGNEEAVARFVLETVGRVVRTEANNLSGFGIRSRISVLADSDFDGVNRDV